ncbi:MAG: bifunctional folylpolyglutamate synthase/dihydrofolate synthase, partial [Luteolibacter sp.]
MGEAEIVMQYREAIDWLFSTQWFGIKLGLEGAQQLLREMAAYPKHGTQVIHVAGTNGKGSTCAMIDAVARAGGCRSGLFTSPHLVEFRERIRVSGEMIPEDDCARILGELKDVCERMESHPTFFEITVALAMRWFRESGCELVILETGMGGRLDATTAVPADVCVFTPIGMDHMQWLGDSLEKIAGEKAGILCDGKPAVSAPQDRVARLVLEQAASRMAAPIEFVDEPLLGYHIA